MLKTFLWTLLSVIALLSPLEAQADSVNEISCFPDEGIYAFDRVDITWELAHSEFDSVTVDLGDGSRRVMAPTIQGLRHHYLGEGQYTVVVTAWENGQADATGLESPIRVMRRAVPGYNVVFLHHSTGRYMLRDSGYRSLIQWHNEVAGTEIRFWDHDYHSNNVYTGLILPDSLVYSDWSYGIEANNIRPAGYHEIFVEAPVFRDSLLGRHDVIMIKNDHSTGDIESDQQLDQYRAQYLEIRSVLDTFPDKLFVLISGPPRRPEKTTPEKAARARAFYRWLQSPEFLNGHPNIAFFDLFSELAYPEVEGDPESNMLREEFRVAATNDDHPNEHANLTVGPRLADFTLRLMDPDFYIDVAQIPEISAPGVRLLPAVPNPFNPATRISWELDLPAAVSLSVYDLAGHQIRSLLTEVEMGAGTHATNWLGRDDAGRSQPSGMYFYRLETAGFALTGRMTLVR